MADKVFEGGIEDKVCDDVWDVIDVNLWGRGACIVHTIADLDGSFWREKRFLALS